MTPVLNPSPASRPSRTALNTGMSPIGVLSVWPVRPGEVPKTTLPPEKAWLTGVTWLDSPPRMFRTQTRSSRVATLASESMPTKYLNPRMPCLPIAPPHLLAPARLHPAIGGLGVVDHLADRGIEAEEAVGQPERIDRAGERAHAADQVRPAPPDDDEQRRGAVRAEMLAQRVRDRPQGREDVRVVRFAADHEQHVGLGQIVFEADAGHLAHLLVWRVAAEIGRYDG